jgi:hypothetical protein
LREARGTGEIIVIAPEGTTGEIFEPLDWQISGFPDTCAMMSGGSKLLVGRGGKFAVKINRIFPSIASRSQGTSTRISKEKDAVEIVEDIGESEPGGEKKDSGLRSFLKSVFGRCF